MFGRITFAAEWVSKMSKGVYGAFGLVLLWMAFASFFIAFHPGGLRSPMFVDPQKNPTGLARNPRDALLYFIEKLTTGVAPKAGPNTV
jgi:hypothetical protein